MRIACVSQFIPGNQKTMHFYDLSAELISGRAGTQENRYETFGQNASCHGRSGRSLSGASFRTSFEYRQDAQTSS